MATRKTISDKDQKWMNKLTDKINKLYPNAVSPFDHLQLMQELVRLRPGFEITSSKEYKRVFEWAFISGYFCAIQNEILKSEKKSAIKGFLQTDFIRRQKKELERNRINLNYSPQITIKEFKKLIFVCLKLYL